MRALSLSVRAAVTFASIAACSADGAGAKRPTTGAPANTPTAQPGRGAAAPNGAFGNSSMTPAMNAAAPVSMTQAPPNKTIGNTDPINIDQCSAQNPAGLGDADVKKLMAGVGNATGLRLLYPYDGTVFPRGLFAPLLMWDGSDAEFAYLHIKATRFEYKGCLKPTAPGQLAVPEDAWKAAGERTMGATDPFTVELTLMSAGTVKGPLSEQIVIAQATLKGSIFYNSYTSKLPGGDNTGQPGGIPGLGGGIGGGPGGGSGSVLRIPPGGTAERFTSTECNGCHSVSANGARLLSSTALNGAVSYALTPTSQPNPPSMTAGPRGAFGALYPDGSIYLATSAVTDVARSSLAQGPGAPTDATMYQTDTGMVIANTGIPTGALMPIFSPDGTLLAFNDYAVSAAHGLALMSFDIATKTASNYRVLYTDSMLQPAWPFILPDNNGVIFARTASTEFSGEGVGINGSTKGPSSELYVADMKTGVATILARAMGYQTPADAAAGTTYLPFGSEELQMAYYPTESPVAAGGYFWVLFDSMRHYGNLGLQRQLWGTAVSIAPDGNYNLDLSHPAFYLPGQEFGTANHRAFAALEPCKQDGNDCTSGVDCCGGFCFVPDAQNQEFVTEAKGTCSSMKPPTCARTNERCATSADCCPPEAGKPANMCIAGFCAVLQEHVQ
jgi:hypothetical protein